MIEAPGGPPHCPPLSPLAAATANPAEAKAAIRDQIDALRRVQHYVGVLKDDHAFHFDLQHTIVQRAVDHWTGTRRLDAEKAAPFATNERVLAVMPKIQKLQLLCQEANFPVPIEAVRRGNLVDDEIQPKVARLQEVLKAMDAPKAPPPPPKADADPDEMDAGPEDEPFDFGLDGTFFQRLFWSLHRSVWMLVLMMAIGKGAILFTNSTLGPPDLTPRPAAVTPHEDL